MDPLPIEKNLRILVIDDNRAIHEDFQKIFRGDAEGESIESAEAALFEYEPQAPPTSLFTLDSAYQGRDGLIRVEASLAAGQPYAMAFVDVRMPPGWDGIETIGHIWRADPDLQVVICTAYSDYCWEDMTRRLGRQDRWVILKKPFDNIEVLQLAGALTEKWQLLRQARLHLQNLEAILARRTEQLHQKEEHFRLVTENAADLIAIVDPLGRARDRNSSAERLSDPTIAVPELADPLVQIAAFERTAESDSMRLLAKSWAGESHGAPGRNAGGENDRVTSVSRDVRDDQKVERQRLWLEAQLRQVQKLKSMGQLAAGIAHEINTPTQYIGDNMRFVRDSFLDLLPALTVAQDLIEAAQNNHLTEEAVAAAAAVLKASDTDYLVGEIPKALDQSLQGIERVAHIVRAMKEFSHPGTTEKALVDLNRAIDSTLIVASNEWKYVADLETDFAPTLPLVRCLSGELNQVILNLVVNAAQAISEATAAGSKGKGKLKVGTRQQGAWVEIRIQDTGAGIPERIRERIFDPYFTTKPIGQGTGQGLAIARSLIVDKHGGTIQFETELNQGTTFIVRLPISGGCERK